MRASRSGSWAAAVLACGVAPFVGVGCEDTPAPQTQPAETRPSPGPPGESSATLTNAIGMKLVYIKPGSFMMGSTQSAKEVARLAKSRTDLYTDEHPPHRVTITKGFHMGAHEVTQEQYETVMGRNPSHFRKGGDYPVEGVSWEKATEFCRKLSAREGQTYRLPTEAEWEYACRAGTTTPFAFGNTISVGQANYDSRHVYGTGQKGKYRKCTTPVGTLKPNAWGLYDMHGNVWEWCQDWHAAGYYARSPSTDPPGPESGQSRVLRGGSWGSPPHYCRSVFRLWFHPSYRSCLNGFRVVLAPEPPEPPKPPAPTPVP